MSGTHVFYNGVELRDCLTKSFDQTVVLDESRNLLTSKFLIRVDSLVFGFFNSAASEPTTPEQLGSHPSTIITRDVGDYATDRMHIIQNRLNQPRKDFWYATHGGRREDVDESIYQILIAATGSDFGDADNPEYFKDILGNDVQILYKAGYNTGVGADANKIPRHNVIDTNNGPIPLDVQITELYGGRAFRVSFEIEVHRHLCLEQEPTSQKPDRIGLNDNPKSNEFVISNTWSTEETCDEQFRRIRTVEGTLRVRDQRYWAQGFRSLCLPGLIPGYRRSSQRFASDPTNLVLKYRVEDKQAEAAPLWPAIDWVMTHTDSAKNEYGSVERQVSIKLIGMPRASKAHLIGVALNILDSRFVGAVAPIVDAAQFLAVRPIPFIREGLVISQASDKPEVEVLCNIRMHIPDFFPAVESSSSQLSIAGYNPDSWPSPRPYDADAPAGIFACYLQTPCNQWHGMPESQTLDLEETDTDNDISVAVETGSNYWEESDYEEYQSPVPLTHAANVNRVEHLATPYTHIEIDTRYSKSEGNLVLPYSKARNLAEEGDPPIYNTIAVIPIHAGVQTRTITVIATRHGFPPEVPEPAPVLVDPNGIVEKLIGTSEIVLDAPQASTDQSHRVFAIQAKFTYALARPLENHEVFRTANNPTLASSPGHNWLQGFSFFSRGRIEYHRLPDYPPEVLAPFRNPGETYDPDTGGPIT